MVEKRLLVPARLRQVPGDGFSWVDRRFVREVAGQLSAEAILLYLFLAAVADKRGLSYWGDVTTASRLKLEVASVRRARQELIARDLVAFEAPLTQVLALPQPSSRGTDAGPRSLAAIFQELAAGAGGAGRSGKESP